MQSKTKTLFRRILSTVQVFGILFFCGLIGWIMYCSMQNTTLEEAINHVVVANIKRDVTDAERTVNGSGERALYVFVREDCPACKTLASELPLVNDATIYTFYLPVGGETGEELEKRQRNAKKMADFGFNAVPALVNKTGRVEYGSAPSAFLDAFIDNDFST